MGVGQKTMVGLLVLLGTVGIASGAVAKEKEIPYEDLPLNQLGIPAALDAVTEFNTYWRDESMAGDAVFLFGLPSYKDKDLVQMAKRTQRFYEQMLYQQPGQQILRTRDLTTPFCDSLLETPSPCAVSVQPPAPAPAPMPRPVAPPAPPVRALW